ncbi:phosphatase PAP2 family protein [Methylobacterium sp. E-065]|uniref:phosphatase PAP2 family protein n=1 Tax=Methylobacterium sp. E-065 TaxID=2836583 RepID=UPI001FBB2211|nr:phosphatase PAP2 family protein [Methylobacterium sp. E-065]MCJ2016902.1 phosphatase PAP2 family protein [Methylobacterium sp. E-065]
MTYPVVDPLTSIDPDKLRVNAIFPSSAWRSDYFSYLALAEFGRTDWRCINNFDLPKAFDDDDMIEELEMLIAFARDKRASRTQEILDQDPGPPPYFAHMLMLSGSSHPNTLRLIDMADRVGLMIAMYFKAIFNRARPQQVFPALLPLVNSPPHPSFPSGHSLESHMIALALTDVTPADGPALISLANRIGENREIAGVHWPSDTNAGRSIAQQAYPLLSQCPIFKTVLAQAQAEPGGPLQLVSPPECQMETRSRRPSSKLTRRREV